LIPDESSLKNDVAKQVILTEVMRRENRLTTGPNKRRQTKYIDFSNYSHIINFEETKGFFKAMKELYRQVLEFASSEGSTKRKRKSIIKDVENQVQDSNDSTTTIASRDRISNSPEEPFARASVLETERSMNENEGMHNTYNSNDTFDGSGQLSLSYTIEDLNSSQTDEDRDDKRRQRKDKKRREKLNKFRACDDTMDPTDYEIINRFLLKVHSQIDRLDSAGRTLRHIFEKNSDKLQFEAFRVFIMNLEVYGSFLPLNEKLYDPQVTRISSNLKVGKLRKRLDETIRDFEN